MKICFLKSLSLRRWQWTILSLVVLTSSTVLFIRFGSTLFTDLRFKFSLSPTFLPEEKVLVCENRIRGYSLKSPPSDRLNLLLPPVLEAAVYITDRRVLLVVHIFRILSGEHSRWFEGKSEPGAKELIKEVNVGKRPRLGPYLEIISESSEKRWYRSPETQLRLFMRNPEPIRKIIAEEMTGDSH